MKKSGQAARYVFFAVIFAAGLFLAGSLRHTQRQAVNLTEDDSGKPITVSKGAIILLKLHDHVDGGYRFDSLQYNATVIKLQKHSNVAPAKNRYGSSGIDTWQFTATAKGKSVLKLTATRPWKGGGTVTVFDNLVIVK